MLKKINLFSYFSELILIFLIIFAPFYHGSLHHPARSILQFSSFFLFAVFLVRIGIISKPRVICPPAIFFMGVFFAIALFQLIPFSQSILNTLSSQTLKLYQQYMPFIGQNNNYTLTIYPFATKREIVMLFACFSLFFVILNGSGKKAKLERLVVIIILWAVALALYGIMRKFVILGGNQSLMFSTFGNKNHYAGYMAMITPLAFGYAFSCRDKYKRLLFGFLGSIILTSIFISASRGGTLSAIFALLLLPFLSFRKHSIRNDILVILAVFIFIVIMVLIGDVGDLHKKFSDLGISSAGRWTILRDSLGLVKDFPLFGIGLGNFRYIFTKYSQHPIASYQLLNDHFQLFLEIGLIGLISCLLFFVLVFKDIFLQLQRKRDPFVINVVAGGLCGLFAAIIHNWFDFNFHIPAFLFMFWIILGLIYKCAHMSYREEGILLRTRGSYLLFVVGATPLLFSWAFIFSDFKSTSLHKKVISKPPPISKREKLYYYQDNLTLISKAMQLSKGNAERYTEKSDYLQKAIKDGATKELFIDKKEIEELYKKAIVLNPTNFLYHFKLGQFYANEERLEEAEKELIKSLNLYPINSEVRLYLARYYLKRIKKEFVEKEEGEIFRSLLIAINIAKHKRWELLKEIKEVIKELPSISWDEREQQLIYKADLGSDRYDFKEENFSHEKIPLTIRLYIEGPVQEVILYRRYVRSKIFRKIGVISEYTIYEVKIDSFPEDTYLDDFRIETYPATVIDKIEIVKSFK